MSSARSIALAESPRDADAPVAVCSRLHSTATMAKTGPASNAIAASQHTALTAASARDEEFTDGSGEDDAEDDDDDFLGGKSQGDDSAPHSLDSEGAGAASSPALGIGIDAVAAPNRQRNLRQRIRIRGYRPLDELRSFAKVLITSLNREFVTPRVDYTVTTPASLQEGLGDAHIMGATLYNQMKAWLNGSNDECARDMAAYFKANTRSICLFYTLVHTLSPCAHSTLLSSLTCI
jgi:hypothetical protein